MHIYVMVSPGNVTWKHHSVNGLVGGEVKLDKIKNISFCSSWFWMDSIWARLLCIYFEVAKQHPASVAVVSLLKLCLHRRGCFSSRQAAGIRSNTSPNMSEPEKSQVLLLKRAWKTNFWVPFSKQYTEKKTKLTLCAASSKDSREGKWHQRSSVH